MTSRFERNFAQMLLHLPEQGQTLREICPECGGGTHKEKSLALTLDDHGYLLWHCFRASCGFSGKRLAWGVVQGSGSTPKKASEGFTGALTTLPKEQTDWLWDMYRLAPKEEWRWAPEYERMYLPVLGPSGKHRGCILRDTTIMHKAKTLTFKDAVDDPWMHWNLAGEGVPVLVEDMFSSAKVQQSGLTSVCLLGTHLGMEKIRELLTETSKCILALDKDAYCKAIKYAVQYQPLIEMRVWQLDKDLKFVPEERIIEAYFFGKETFSSGS